MNKEEIKQILIEDVLNQFEHTFDDVDANDNFQNLYEISKHSQIFYSMFKHIDYGNNNVYELLKLFSRMQHDILDDGEMNLIWIEYSHAHNIIDRTIRQNDWFIVSREWDYINDKYLTKLFQETGYSIDYSTFKIDNVYMSLFQYEDLEWFAKEYVPEFKKFENDYPCPIPGNDFELNRKLITEHKMNESIVENKIKQHIINHKYFRKYNA